MLNFTRKSSDAKHPHDIVDLVNRTIELAASDYNLNDRYDFRRIRIIKNYKTDVPTVNCNGGQIQQVILNLLKNGAEAMKGNNFVANPPRFFDFNP